MCSEIIAQALATLGPKPPTLSQIVLSGQAIHGSYDGIDDIDDFEPDEAELQR